ncbi:MAG TPA: hypothetical protein VGL42_00365 [Opitutaceae bacterium]|jgi:rod shape-determining protein MreD
MRHGLIVFGTLVLLWTLSGIVNDALAPLRVHLFLGGLFVAFGASALSPRAGFWTVLAGGALCDVGSALPFGAFALLFGLAHAVLIQTRRRLPHDHVVGRIAIALLVNLGLFLFVSFARLHGAPEPGTFWARTLVDLLASQFVLVLIGPWFFALQAQALTYARP